MNKLHIILIASLALAACSGAKVERLRHPLTGHIVKCSGPASLPDVVDVNRCIHDHQEQGYEILP